MTSPYQRYEPIPNRRVRGLLDASRKGRPYVLRNFARRELLPGELLHGLESTVYLLTECLRYELDINEGKTRKAGKHLNSKHSIDAARILRHCDTEQNVKIETIAAILLHDTIEDGLVESDTLYDHLLDIAKDTPLLPRVGVSIARQRADYNQAALDAFAIIDRLSDPFYKNLTNIRSQIAEWDLTNRPYLQQHYPDIVRLFDLVMRAKDHSMSYVARLRTLASHIQRMPLEEIRGVPYIQETLDVIMDTRKDHLYYLLHQIYRQGNDRRPRRAKPADRIAQNFELVGIPISRVLLSLVKNFCNTDFSCLYINGTRKPNERPDNTKPRDEYDNTFVTLKDYLIQSTLNEVIYPYLRRLRRQLPSRIARRIEDNVEQYADSESIKELTQGVTPNDVMRNVYLPAMKGNYEPLLQLEEDVETQYRHFLLLKHIFGLYAEDAANVTAGKHDPHKLFTFEWRGELPADVDGNNHSGSRRRNGNRTNSNSTHGGNGK
ncbi:hypothetical protein HY491_00130 [Candidatus Woesearchaeota archaeon]|nr:hypothetical protein [Candidatus Woesearchaeota archaeon]